MVGDFFALVTWWGDGRICIPVMTFVAWRHRGDLARTEWQRLFLFSAVLALMVVLLKTGLGRARPGAVFDAAQGYQHRGDLLQARSFPSGHTATALWAYLFASRFKTTTQIRHTLLILLVFVGLSRVVIGAHFLSDVLGAIIIGSATFQIICAKTRGLRGGQGNEP